MTITVNQFRANFPEFSSSTTYPASGLQFQLDLAYTMLNAGRWGRQLDFGAQLYAAHNVVIEAKAMTSAQSGGIPGGQAGVVSSKSVDKVSVGYDTGATNENDAGHWNLTTYGTRFLRLARMFGAGGIQVGIGAVPTGSGQAWSGPYVMPNPS